MGDLIQTISIIMLNVKLCKQAVKKYKRYIEFYKKIQLYVDWKKFTLIVRIYIR